MSEELEKAFRDIFGMLRTRKKFMIKELMRGEVEQREIQKKTKENLFAFIHSLLDDSVTQKKL